MGRFAAHFRYLVHFRNLVLLPYFYKCQVNQLVEVPDTKYIFCITIYEDLQEIET